VTALAHSSIWFENHGLLFRAPFLISGLNETDPPTHAGRSDVDIVHGKVPTEEAGSRMAGEHEIRGADIVLEISGTGRFLMQDGRRIVVDAQKNADQGLVRAFVSGPAIAILLHQRRAMPLHASCVSRNGGAIAFVGDSEAGKSTTAMLFSKAGYDILSDDIITIRQREKLAMVNPANRSAKLWDDAARMLQVDDVLTEPEYPGTAKKLVTPSSGPSTPQRLDAIFILRWLYPHDMAPEVRRLEALDALGQLRKNIYRPDLVKVLGLEGAYMSKLADLVRTTPIYVLARPRSDVRLPDIPGIVAGAIGLQSC